jgi:hypothetical protein
MEHFLTRPGEESTVIESTRPKLNRLKYAAMLLGALAVAATPLANPAIATAQRVWDIEYFDTCRDAWLAEYQKGTITFQDFHDGVRGCCNLSDGVWNAAEQECQAPPGDSQGSRQLPGNAQIPSDIVTAPALTPAPARPIRVPSDIATVTAVSQAPA